MKDKNMSSQKEKTTKKYRLDIIVIAGILLVALLLALGVYLIREEGNTVRVEVDGITVGEYPLSVDGIFSLNGGTNILVVENGEVYLSYSNCPDHLCEGMGRIRYVGESIICLPNRVAVKIVGGGTGGVDFVA